MYLNLNKKRKTKTSFPFIKIHKKKSPYLLTAFKAASKAGSI